MRLRRGEGPPIRLLTAVPICDGHDSAINTLNLEFIRHGIEVIYLGYHRSARDIVRAAIQEDARAIGISSYNGGHLEFFAEVLARLKQQGASSIGVFGGGGGTITPDDAARMKGRGVDEIFFAGTSLDDMVKISVLLLDLADFTKVNEIMASYFKAPYPARATYQVAGLPRGARIEVEGILVLPAAAAASRSAG